MRVISLLAVLLSTVGTLAIAAPAPQAAAAPVVDYDAAIGDEAPVVLARRGRNGPPDGFGRGFKPPGGFKMPKFGGKMPDFGGMAKKFGGKMPNLGDMAKKFGGGKGFPGGFGAGRKGFPGGGAEGGPDGLSENDGAMYDTDAADAYYNNYGYSSANDDDEVVEEEFEDDEAADGEELDEEEAVDEEELDGEEVEDDE
ncbi:hypothetical protein DFJ73DRAFT_774427 [Zopfochytrium polystomum]|nr:hypothetical protein DFJ73DRAFT_774427 [Zopfochytrium polystomum]